MIKFTSLNIKKFNKNKWVIFTLNLYTIYSIIKEVLNGKYDWFVSIKINLGIQEILLFFTTLIIFYVWKQIDKLRTDTQNAFNKTYIDLNKSHYALNTKIRYVQLMQRCDGLNELEVFKVLQLNGFSKEDIELLQIEGSYIYEKRSDFLPKEIINKIESLNKDIDDFYKQKNL